MSEKWKPTEEQNTGPISRVSEFFIDELNELQEELESYQDYEDEEKRDTIQAQDILMLDRISI